jgi:predicted dehydrogenase
MQTPYEKTFRNSLEEAGAMSVTIAVAGAGLRGTIYARRLRRTGAARIVAVAEPDPFRRATFAREHGIPKSGVFEDWRALATGGRVADGVIIATQDTEHVEPAVAFADLGYHILLEKPMATTERDCVRIVEAVEAGTRILAVGHVMRYTAYTREIRRLIADGRIGVPTSMQHLEPVGWWHQAHSFVRGNWRRSDRSGPMLLTKSCHDIDWIMYVLGEIPERVSSFGRLSHFHPGNRPDGATDRCVSCPVEEACPYSATRLYLSCLGDPEKESWPLAAVTSDLTEDGVLTALRDGPYGRCVYACDNDVVDHQVVNLEFPSGATASFTMTAFTPLALRQTRVFGTRGYLEGDGTLLTLHDFVTGAIETIETHSSSDSGGAEPYGHRDADEALADAFAAAVAHDEPSLVWSSARESLAGHQVVWAAEEARRTGTVVELTSLKKGTQ